MPPSCGFPPKSFPLKGNPPFWGKPSALGHEGVRGRRLHGAAMLCRLQCARFAIRWHIADALPSSPTRLTLRVTIAIPSVRHFVISHGAPAGKISDFSRGARGAALKRALPCERLVSGSTPNKITSCLRTSRSSCSLDRLQSVFGALKDASNECALVSGST